MEKLPREADEISQPGEDHGQCENTGSNKNQRYAYAREPKSRGEIFRVDIQMY